MRKACEIDKNNHKYRVALVKLLFEMQHYKECVTYLKPMTNNIDEIFHRDH